MRAAVVGLGWWGRNVLGNLADSERIEVTHGVDPAHNSVAELAGKYGIRLVGDYDEVIDDPAVDAVILTSPNTLHETQVIKAAKAGKQIFCEKPLTLSVEGAKRMLDACDRAGITLGLGHERRWEPAMEEVFRLVREKAIGSTLQVETNFSHNLFNKLAPDNWRFDSVASPGGGFTARAIHLTDFMVSMFGRASRVWATTASIAYAPPRIDTLAAHITFANGISALLGTSIATPFYGRFTVYGDQGWVEHREFTNSEDDVPAELILSDVNANRTVSQHAVINTVKANFEDWARAVETGSAYRIKPDEMLANMEIFEGVVRSSRTGKVVEITR
jgi:predicted dehydrogenase